MQESAAPRWTLRRTRLRDGADLDSIHSPPTRCFAGGNEERGVKIYSDCLLLRSGLTRFMPRMGADQSGCE